MTEKEFQKLVIDLAHLHGWKCAFFRPARVRRGGRETYETPVGADGRGWPDLVLVRRGRVVAAELKVGRNKLTPDQEAWLAALAAGGVEAHVWRPDDWDDIVFVLSGAAGVSVTHDDGEA